MNKKVLREVRLLCIPIVLFCAFSFYWQQKNKDTGIAVRSTKFFVNADGEYGYRPMSHFGFWMGYKGRKPAWWGNQTSYCYIEDFKLFDRNGRLLQAAPFKQNNLRYGDLQKMSSRHNASRDQYYSAIAMTLPYNSPVNGGRVQATIQIVDSYKNPKKIYAEMKVDMVVDVDCNYDGC